MARDISKLTFKKLIQFRKSIICFRNAPSTLPVDLPRTRYLRGQRFANPDFFSGFALDFLNMSRVLGGQFAPRLHASDFGTILGAFWDQFGLLGRSWGPRRVPRAPKSVPKSSRSALRASKIAPGGSGSGPGVKKDANMVNLGVILGSFWGQFWGHFGVRKASSKKEGRKSEK